MLKKASIALVLASLVSTTALADGTHSSYAPSVPSSSGGEDHLVLKLRGGYLDTKFKSTKAGISNKNKSGYTAEIALDYFFTDNIALEGSVAWNSTKTPFASGKLNTIPVSILAQYHFMPEASVSPYIGVGYSYQFINKSPKLHKLENAGAIIGQVGLDIPYNDTMGFNIDAKYAYQARHKLKENGIKVGTVKTSPATISAGVTFAF
jgi:outer membrane protein